MKPGITAGDRRVQRFPVRVIRAGLAEVYRGRTPEGFDKRAYLTSAARARASLAGMRRQGRVYVSPIRWRHSR